MANSDITRQQPGNHYVGVRMQQGRTLLDSDWNEGARLEAEDRRLTIVDLVGAIGSSNLGFRITNVVATTPTTSAGPAKLDFEIHPGSHYLGGVRVVVDEPGETFLAQRDWLRQELDGGQPSAPTAKDLLPDPKLTPSYVGLNNIDVFALAPKYRYDLVYLEAWEQPVTVVEDSELRERALGGPDSSVRIRRMRRIKVVPDVGTADPAEAFVAHGGKLIESGQGIGDPATHELMSAARLTVSPIAPGGGHPCAAQPPSGFVGHEDVAIRVEMRGPTSFTWGYSNAAPLYRVKVGVDGKRISFINTPRDVRRQPKADQIVEIIPWGAKLPNGEKVAELQGALIRVRESYDPVTGELVLAEPVPTIWTDFIRKAREHWNPSDGDNGGYFYLRVWDRGSDTASPVTIELGTKPTPLGNTGLEITMTGVARTGDYWVIGARRATPESVVPWQLLSNAAPLGPRQFLAPLAVIRWEAPLRQLTQAQLGAYDPATIHHLVLGVETGQFAVWGPVKAKVIDGRRRLQPLSISSCCTITVGDGDISDGLVNSLEEALALLPASGGRVCLLPGEHVAEVALSGRANIEICGLGAATKLVNKTVYGGGSEIVDRGTSLITLTDCANIVLRDFEMVAESAVAIEIRGDESQCNDILIENIQFTQGGTYTLDPDSFALPQPAVLALGGEDLCVRGCRVDIANVLSYTGAIVIGGKRLRIHDNWVQAGDFEASTIAASMGGIHVLSQSEDVEVTANVVHGGWGFGIALGHAIAWDDEPNAGSLITMADVWDAGARGLGEPLSGVFGYKPAPAAPTGSPGLDKGWTPAGHLIDVRLDRNRVTGMGLTGISTGMLGFEYNDGLFNYFTAFIVNVRLRVTGNIVIGNRRIGLSTTVFEPRPDRTYDMAVGGVVITAAIDATVAENRIIDNGANVNTPNCGLGFIAMQNLVIRDNVIADNGQKAASGATPPIGLRGGIAIMEITGLRGMTFHDTLHANLSLPAQDISVGSSKLALEIYKNEITQRCGRALWVPRGFDNIVVRENSFFSYGDPVDDTTVGITGVKLEYEASLFGVPLDVDHDAAGACVEICNFSLAPDISDLTLPTPPTLLIVEPGASTTVGGTVEFVGNCGKLDWDFDGGYASAFLLSSLDCVVVTNNSLSATMHGGAGDFGSTFLQGLLTTPANYSFVICNCYVGSFHTAIVQGNRFSEGPRDALLSVLVGPATQNPFDIDYRGFTALASCVGSHCGYVVDLELGGLVGASNQNVFIYKPPSLNDCSTYISDITISGTNIIKISH